MSFNPDNKTISGSTDASINSPSDHHFLKYDSASQKWTNTQPAVDSVSGLQTTLDGKAPADPIPGLSKVYVIAPGAAVPSNVPSGTLIVELSEQ